MKTKNKFAGIVSIILIGLALIFSVALASRNIIFLSGIIPIDNIEGTLTKGEYVQGDLRLDDSPFLRLDHSINLIPAGKELFYLAYDEKTNTVYYIRGNKALGKKAKENEVLHIKGKVYKANSDSRNNLSEYSSKVIEEGFNIGYKGDVLFIDTNAFSRSVFNVLGIVFIFAGLLVMTLTPLASKPVNTFVFIDHVIVFASLALILIGCGILLHITNYVL